MATMPDMPPRATSKTRSAIKYAIMSAGTNIRSKSTVTIDEKLQEHLKPVVLNTVSKWKKYHEQKMMNKLVVARTRKKEERGKRYEDAATLAQKIAIDVLAKEWFCDQAITIEVRCYLLDSLLPILIIGVEKLLQDVDKRNLSGKEETDWNFNPINRLAQFLMRHNPKYCNFLEQSPYVRGLRVVAAELHTHLLEVQENNVVRLKSQINKRRKERQRQDESKQKEMDRRQSVLTDHFTEWNIGGEKQVDLGVLQKSLRTFGEVVESYPPELQAATKYTGDMEQSDETGKSLTSVAFFEYIQSYVDRMPSEVFDNFVQHLTTCAELHKDNVAREYRRITLTNLFTSCDHSGVGLLDRHRVLNLFELFWDAADECNQDKMRNPRRWPVVEVEEAEDTHYVDSNDLDQGDYSTRPDEVWFPDFINEAAKEQEEEEARLKLEEEMRVAMEEEKRLREEEEANQPKSESVEQLPQAEQQSIVEDKSREEDKSKEEESEDIYPRSNETTNPDTEPLMTEDTPVTTEKTTEQSELTDENQADAQKTLSPKVSVEKPEVAPEKSEIAPEKSEVAPEQSEIAPEQTEIAPEKMEVAAEQSEIAPEQSQIAPEKSEVAPEKSEVAPEQSAISNQLNQPESAGFTTDKAKSDEGSLAPVRSVPLSTKASEQVSKPASNVSVSPSKDSKLGSCKSSFEKSMAHKLSSAVVTFAAEPPQREKTGASLISRSQSQMSSFDENVINVAQFVHLIETFIGSNPVRETFVQLVDYFYEGYEETEQERTSRLMKARKEAIKATHKTKLDTLFERWDNDGSGFLDMDEVENVIMKYKGGMEVEALAKAKNSLVGTTVYKDQRLNKREFRQLIETMVQEIPGSETFEYFVDFLTVSVERSYVEKIRGEARRKWLMTIVRAAETGGSRMDPVYKALFLALYKDAEAHGGGKKISASLSMLENNRGSERGDVLLRYIATTPEDAEFMLGKALYKDMKGISFSAIESGKPLHVPRVSNHGNILFWNPKRKKPEDREGSFIVIPLKDRRKRVFGLLGLDTLNDPQRKAIFITHEVLFFQGVAKAFSIAFHHVDIRRKLLRITESAISWIQRRSTNVKEINIYMTEPNANDTDYLLRKMMVTDHKGNPIPFDIPPKLERKDNLFRDYLFKCVDTSETVAADAYGERHLAIPLRNDKGLAIAVIDISIGELRRLPIHENREVQRMLKLLQQAHSEITKEFAGEEDAQVVLQAEHDDDARVDVMFDRLMLMELRENMTKLDAAAYAELHSYADPPVVIHDILKAVLSVFYIDIAASGTFDDWNTVRNYVNADLSAKIQTYDPTVEENLIPAEQVMQLLKDVPHGSVQKHASQPAEYLYNWVFVCLSLIEHTRKMRTNTDNFQAQDSQKPTKTQSEPFAFD